MQREKVDGRWQLVRDLCAEYHAQGVLYEQLKFCEYWGYERALASHVVTREFGIPSVAVDRQNATGANAFGVTGDLYRNYHRDRLVVEELHKIHVEDVLRNGVELQVLQSRFERFARGEFQIYDECIRRVNQRIQILGIHRKVNRIFTAVDYTRHTTSIT